MHALSASEVQWVIKSMEQTLMSAGDKSFELTMEDICPVLPDAEDDYCLAFLQGDILDIW